MRFKVPTQKRDIFPIAGFCIILIFLTVSPMRVDLSTGKLFSLSISSQELAKEINQPVEVNFYFSETNRSLSPGAKAFAERVIELLYAYQKSNPIITVNSIDPTPDSDEEVLAQKIGLTAIPAPGGEFAYLGLQFQSSKESLVIPYLDPNSEDRLEYTLSEAFYRVTTQEKPRIGVYSSLDLFGNSKSNTETWAIINNLAKLVKVEKIDLKTPLSSDISAVFVIHPKQIDEVSEFFLDQYLLAGGRLLIAIDAYSRIEQLQNRNQILGNVASAPASSNLSRLLAAWSVDFDDRLIVGDLSRAKKIKSINRTFHYPFFLDLKKQDLNPDHPITNQLKHLVFAEPGFLTFLPRDNQKLSVLAQTTKESGIIKSDMTNFLGPTELAARLKSDGKIRSMAGIIEVRFKSAFNSTASDPGSNFLKKSSKYGAVLIVSDIDFIHDSNSIDKINFYSKTIFKSKNDNIKFLVNALEYLTDNTKLLQIRASSKIQREFTVFEDLSNAAIALYRKDQLIVNSKLKALQSKLEAKKVKNSGSFEPTATDPAELASLKEQEASLRLKKREIKFKLREDINRLKTRLNLLNILPVPLILIFLASIVLSRRNRKTN